MSASKSTYRQDMPPKGGFAPVIKLPDTKRKGFSNIALLGLATGLITYGIAKYLYYQKQENELRMARVEERTEYAKKVDQYYRDQRAKQRELIDRVLQREIDKRKAELAQPESS